MKTIYFLLGLLFITLGVIGVFIPIWPTTPFVLLSIFFFSKSNKDFSEYIMNSKWVGKHLRNYYENRQMTKSFKIKTILFLWAGLSIAIILHHNFTVQIVLAFIGLLVTIHIMLLKQ